MYNQFAITGLSALNKTLLLLDPHREKSVCTSENNQDVNSARFFSSLNVEYIFFLSSRGENFPGFEYTYLY